MKHPKMLKTEAEGSFKKYYFDFEQLKSAQPADRHDIQKLI